MIWCLSFVISFSVICFIGISITHMVVFSRADYDEYGSEKFLLYNDIAAQKYPRDIIKILSGKHTLTGYLYGTDSTQGLIIISPGHRDPNDIKCMKSPTLLMLVGWCFVMTTLDVSAVRAAA